MSPIKIHSIIHKGNLVENLSVEQYETSFCNSYPLFCDFFPPCMQEIASQQTSRLSKGETLEMYLSNNLESSGGVLVLLDDITNFIFHTARRRDIINLLINKLEHSALQRRNPLGRSSHNQRFNQRTRKNPLCRGTVERGAMSSGEMNSPKLKSASGETLIYSYLAREACDGAALKLEQRNN